jgi:acylaminoacyl-peptidase
MKYRPALPIPFDERIRGTCTLQDGVVVHVTEGGSGSAGSDKSQVFIEFWEGANRKKRLLVPGCKDVHFQTSFGGDPVLSGCRRFLIFVGEPSDIKYPRGFWTESTEGLFPGDKFDLRPDFGETMLKQRCPRLVLLDIETDKFCEVNIGSLKLFAAFPTSVPGNESTLFFVGYPNKSKLYSPGFSRCFNRESKIYCIENPADRNPDIRCLTGDIYMALSPIVSPDGRRAVFAGHRDQFSAHCTELSLFELNLETGRIDEIAINRLRNDSCVIPTFNGICLTSQSESTLMKFLPDNRTLIVPSFSSGKSGIFLIDLDARLVKTSIFPPDVSVLSSVNLLGSSGNHIVFVHQGYTTLRSVWLARVSQSDPASVEYCKLIDSPRLSILEKIVPSVSVIQTQNCPAWLLRSGNSDGTKRPLIAYLHGGPHMLAANQFSPEMVCFLASGYDVVIPNYRGSLSFGKSFLNSLIGQAGVVDVQDCHDCVVHARNLLNSSTVIAYGGSHGGFLTAWLLGHPDTKSTYAGGVLWNPAVDLVSSNLTSDIPEWALSQVLEEDEANTVSAFAPSAEFLRVAAERSPMTVVKNVTAPSLVLLGSNDKRVNPSAGLRWAQAVELNGADTQVMWFPEQGHAISGPECYETAITSIALWISKRVESLSLAVNEF